MKKQLYFAILFGFAAVLSGQTTAGPAVLPMQEGFVDANGVLIYYKSLGKGPPLLVVHGGPGASHDYFLPHLLPLARRHRLVFIDERGSGRSPKLEDAKLYTVDNMVEDVEAVRRALGLGKVALLGHSYGGVVAQAYALKYPAGLSSLLLCSTFSSTKEMNKVFDRMKEKMAPQLRERIEKAEKEGLFGKGKDYEKNRYTNDYMVAAWGEGYFPYLYGKRPDPNYDPIAAGNMSWDLYREMWGSHGEYVIDGNLVVCRIHRPPLLDPRAHPHHGRRPRRVRPVPFPRDAREDRRLEARHLPRERPHDLRGSAGAVPAHGRRLPEREVSPDYLLLLRTLSS